MEPLTADRLAAILQEPKRRLLQRVLQVVDHDQVADTLAAALACEAHGGMLTRDGSRWRTPGGTFFTLLKGRVTEEERRQLFPIGAAKRRRWKPPRDPQAPTWKDVWTLVQVLAPSSKGEALRMKLTLIGRPGKVATRNQYVVFRMQGQAPQALPKGLPPASKGTPLTWTVFLALRQWNRVKDRVTTHPDDHLIIEGYPAKEDNQLVLLAQSCTTVALQRAQKAAPGA